MKIQIDVKKKQIIFKGNGFDERLFKIIIAFGGDAIIYPKATETFFEKITSKIANKVVIDATHRNITKQFVQLLMRNLK